jgi:nicotinate phosphoribosyltransferase
MAQGYFRLGWQERRAAFHLNFRSNPFHGQYAICCGLQTVADYLAHWHFSKNDLAYLAGLKSTAHHAIFQKDFLDYLSQLTFSCHLDAIPEGTIVFPHEPLLRIEGPLLQCQLLESILLNTINFQTLIATKASRVVKAAAGDAVIEFGMRRAQGADGALNASRAAYIGGCTATSNVLAGQLFDIPVRGTHAHSWVVAFPDEEAAFKAYIDTHPEDCILLVDTYDTLTGVKHAIAAGHQLRARGFDLLGIRLDSGDLLHLSKKARQLLDEAGFTHTQILASNSLSEEIIQRLKKQGAPIDAWGVGTQLVTAYDCAALDGVYKLSALQDAEGKWEYKIKLSEEPLKISNPGRHQVKRVIQANHFLKDVVYDLEFGIKSAPETTADLLQPIFREGKRVLPAESIHAARDRALMQRAQFEASPPMIPYPVELEPQLHALKTRLSHERRG